MSGSLFRPERAEGESFEAYKKRQIIANRESRKNVRLFWDSANHGTYVNHEKRAAKAARRR